VARNAIPTAVPLANGPPPNLCGIYVGSACRAAPNARYPQSTATHNRFTGTVMEEMILICLIYASVG
jgi:hypothetical protein